MANNSATQSIIANITYNGTVYIITQWSNVSDYSMANQSCQAFGGYLAIIDSNQKQALIESLISQQLGNKTKSTVAYVFG